jgi:hypothetical protein
MNESTVLNNSACQFAGGRDVTTGETYLPIGGGLMLVALCMSRRDHRRADSSIFHQMNHQQ